LTIQERPLSMLFVEFLKLRSPACSLALLGLAHCLLSGTTIGSRGA
jgi:hypothetical protein